MPLPLLLLLALPPAVMARAGPDAPAAYLDRHGRLDPRAVPPLIGDLVSPRPAARRAAYQTLVQLRDRLDGLDDDNFVMLRAACADNDDPDVRPGLQALVEHVRGHLYGDAGRRLVGHRHAVGRLAFAPDGTRLASAGFDGTARVWDVPTGRLVCRVAPPDKYPLYAVAFSPDGRTLATAGEAAHLWDAADGRPLGRLPEAGGSLYDVQFSRDGRSVYAGGGRIDRIFEFDRATGRVRRSWPCGQTSVFRLTRDGGRLFTIPSGVVCWDTATGKDRWVGGRGGPGIDDSWAGTHVLHLRDDGRRVIAVTTRGTVYDHDAATGAVRRPAAVEKYRPYVAAFSPDARRIVVPQDGPAAAVLLLDYPAGTVLHRWRRPGTDIMMLGAVAVSPDERWVAAADGQGAVLLYAVPPALRRR